MHLFVAADANSPTPRLSCHPETPCPSGLHLDARAHRRPDGALALRYRLTGALSLLAVPAPLPVARADGLWRHTCFEAFVGPAEAPLYSEFNFSPSGEWAAYAFSGYRQGMAALATLPPEMTWSRRPDRLELEVVLAPEALPRGPLRVGLSAVLETADASFSYWALRHPPGRPDFHHTDAFALELP